MSARSTRLWALLLSLLLLLAACGDGGGGGDGELGTGADDGADGEGRELVRMVLWPGPEGDAMQEVVDAYNAGQGEEDGIEVEMILLSRDDTFARQATEIGSESSDLDIYFVATYNVGFFSSGLEPIDDVEIDESNYFPVAIDGLTIDDQLYALPLDISNHFLYYRSDLIDTLLSDADWQETYREVSAEVLGEARDPVHPDEWTVDDYLAAAAFFSQSANPDSPTQYGTALQGQTNPFNLTLWNDLLWGLGGSWVDDAGNANLESEEARRAVEVYRTIYTEDFTSRDAAQWEFPETNAALQSGDVAFALQWSAAFAELTDPEASPEVADVIEIARVPGEHRSTHAHALAIGLNAHAENPEAAKVWMRYLATPEAMDAYAKAGGIPSMPQVLDDNIDINPVFAEIATHVDEYGYTPPIFDGTFEALTALAEELGPAWLGVEDVDAALANANERLADRLEN